MSNIILFFHPRSNESHSTTASEVIR